MIEIGTRDVLRSREEPVVRDSIQIESLIPRDLARLGDHAHTELGVRLVTTALLPLAEPARMDLPDDVHNGAHPLATQVVGNALVVDVRAIADHSDGDQRSDIADVPVRPMVGDVRPIVSGEEMVAVRVEILGEHVLEPLEVLGLPARRDTDQLSRYGELSDGNTGESGNIIAGRDLIHLRGPIVADLDGMIDVAVIPEM
ncbi:MAG: hypothetical protein QM755_04800 [Luteolibacter sp.]